MKYVCLSGRFNNLWRYSTSEIVEYRKDKDGSITIITKSGALLHETPSGNCSIASGAAREKMEKITEARRAQTALTLTSNTSDNHKVAKVVEGKSVKTK